MDIENKGASCDQVEAVRKILKERCNAIQRQAIGVELQGWINKDYKEGLH